MKFKFLICLFFINLIYSCDLIIFCHSRPMQLNTLLTMIKQNMPEVENVIILHDHIYQESYFQIKKKFLFENINVTFVNVYVPAQVAIKPSVERCLLDYDSEYVMFADVNLFIEKKIDLCKITENLGNDILCFSNLNKLKEQKSYAFITKKSTIIPFLHELYEMEFTEYDYCPIFSFFNSKQISIRYEKDSIKFLSYPDNRLLNDKFSNGFIIDVNKIKNNKVELSNLVRVS